MAVLARQGFMSVSSWNPSNISSQTPEFRGTARATSMPFPNFGQPVPELCKQPQPVRIWTDYVDNLAEQQVRCFKAPRGDLLWHSLALVLCCLHNITCHSISCLISSMHLAASSLAWAAPNILRQPAFFRGEVTS